MGAFSDAVKNKMLDAVAGRTTYTAEAAYFLKLHTGSPGAAGTSNASAHTTRVATTFGTAAAAGAIANTAAVVFSSLTAAETHSHVSAWSASTGGTFLGADDLPTPRAVIVGDSLTIAIGGVALTVSGALP